MKRTVYAFFTAIALLSVDTAMAQTAPSIDRLTPLQRQQISRDLIPSGAQDFFRAGRTNLEQEIRLFSRPRSPNEHLLKVSQGVLAQPEAQGEPTMLQRD